MRVELGPEEVVEDWTAFREAFVEAAEKVGLTIDQIIHTDTL